MKTKRYRYNVPHACLGCRKVFKLPETHHEQVRAAWLSRRYLSGRSPVKPWKEPPPPTCPQCRGSLEVLGRAFQVPRRLDRAGWQCVGVMVVGGYRFCSLGVGGHASSSVRQMRAWVAARRRKGRHGAA